MLKSDLKECAKFFESRAAVAWIFRGFKIFFRGYFVGLKSFLVLISWVQNFRVNIRGSEIFSRGYFVGQNFFLVSISWVYFVSFSWFRDSKILSCRLHEQEWQKQRYKNTCQTSYSFLNLFQQFSSIYIRKVLHLLNDGITQFSFVATEFLGISFLQY